MSSYFTVPDSTKKRKRSSAREALAPKKRITPSKSQPKPKIPARSSTSTTKKRKPKPQDDESISGSDLDSDESNGHARHRAVSEDGSDKDSDAGGETAAEVRLRLAERYLDNVRQEVVETGFDAEEIDRDLVAERLREDVAESKGRVYRRLANEHDFARATHTMHRWNSNSVTSVAVCAPYAYTTSVDGYLIKWKLQDRPQDQQSQRTVVSKKSQGKQSKKQKPPPPPPPPKRRPERLYTMRSDNRKAKDKSWCGHIDGILAVAASQDGKFVATAGNDHRLVIYDAATLKPLRAFTQHRDAVTGLAFRRGTNQLYSCSEDRTVKVWSLDELAFVETLFGHQDGVVDISALAQERCVSVGARDRTARLWKVVEETQLVFRSGGPATAAEKKVKSASSSANHPPPSHPPPQQQRQNHPAPPPAPLNPLSLAHEGSMDRVAMIDHDLFITGSDNGALTLWNIAKKKPLHVLPHAHGIDPPLPATLASAERHPRVSGSGSSSSDPRKSIIPPPQPRWVTALRAVPYSDLILSGSWDGVVRVWRLSDDKRRIEAVGTLGGCDGDAAPAQSPRPTVNGCNGTASPDVPVNDVGCGGGGSTAHDARPLRAPLIIKGIVNDIAVLERGDRGKGGLCVVVAVGKEHRLGRWKMVDKGRNGIVIFEVPQLGVGR